MEKRLLGEPEIQLISSIQVAELTGKQHSHIMRDIRNLLEQGVSESNFGLSTYQQKQPKGGFKEVPFYQLTKKGSLILASGYNAVLREKIINRWEELELEKRKKFQVPQTFAEALMLAAKQQEQIEEQNQLLLAQGNQITEMQDAITEMLPKVSYCDKILQSKSTVCITQIAQDYGYSAKKFNILLRNFKLQRKVGNQWVLYSPYNTKGYVQSESFIPENSTSGKVVMTSKWTQRGRLFLYEFLKERGVLPLIEQDLEQNKQASEPIKAIAC